MFFSPGSYVLADPIGRPDSGITGYVETAARLLRHEGLDVSIVTRRTSETIQAYRQRLAGHVIRMRDSGPLPVVEAPETDAATAAISPGVARLHIRLHCSRQLGAFVQGQATCQRSLREEQQEILRADIISAPSQTAVTASRLLFDVGPSTHCYPNPPPDWLPRPNEPASEKRHVLFVGRFHALKGAHWAVDLARRLPHIPFVMVVPGGVGTKDLARLPNVRVVDGLTWDKADTFRKARAVIIPSLYETASMVGIEALAAGVPVITWSHLGIAEYAPPPAVVGIAPFDVDAFADAVSRAVEGSNQVTFGSGVFPRLRQSYLEGVRNALTKTQSTTMPEQRNENSVGDIRTTILKARQALPGSTVLVPRWRRKLRKLQRTPLLFLRDSALGQLLFPDRRDTALTSKPRTAVPGGTTPAASAETQVFTEIAAEGRIRFSTPPAKPEGLISAFLYPRTSERLAKSILAGFGSFGDFRYLQSPTLQVGVFDADVGNDDALSIIDRIDVKNKKEISAVDHIILLDPPSSLVAALRSCGTRQRTVVILTEETAAIPDPWHTDVLIVVGEHLPAASMSGWRRKIVVRDLANISIAVRRAIQEGAPKHPNMFLPLIGFSGNRRAELLALDERFHQAVMRLSAEGPHDYGSMEDITSATAKRVTELAVTESVYLRYRNLCDRVDDAATLETFLAYSLYDGVMFDVRV